MNYKNEAKIVEMTTFNLEAGVSEADFITAAQKMQHGFLDRQAGFIKRSLVKGENGWTDVVFWESHEAIIIAMEKAESSSEAGPFMQMIDINTVQMNISEIKYSSVYDNR